MGKKILIIARGIPTLAYPGLGIFEFDQAKALQARGVDVAIFAIDLRSIRRKRKWGFYNLNKDNIPVYILSIPMGNVPKKIFYRIGALAIKKALNKILKGKTFSIVHTHFFEIGALIACIKLPQTITWIHTEHSSSVNKEELHKDIIKYSGFYKQVDTLITVSEALRKSVLYHFNVDSICIPNIIDLDIFKYSPKKNREKFTFVSTGNLVEIKRMDYLVEEFIRTFSNDLEVELLIIGEGPQKRYLESIIEKNSIGDRIKLLGRKMREEISEIYQKSDCFVLLSESETFGVAYVEAMAAGLPIIATKCGGPEEFCKKSVGYLVDKYNTEQLEETLLEVRSRNTFDGKKISSYAKRKFSTDVIVQKIVEIYEME